MHSRPHLALRQFTELPDSQNCTMCTRWNPTGLKDQSASVNDPANDQELKYYMTDLNVLEKY